MTPFLQPVASGSTAGWCLRNTTRDHLIASSFRCVLSGRYRWRRLARRTDLEPGRAVVLAPCHAVCTFGPGSTPDILLIDDLGQVVLARPRMARWSIARHQRASAAIDLPPGTIGRTSTMPGDRIEIEPCHRHC
jgi:hypothetical protein